MKRFLGFSVAVLCTAACLLLAAPAADAAKATLTWQDNSSNEQGFNVQRKIEACAGAAAFAPLAQTAPNVAAYVDLAVAEGGTYCYRVNAYNTAGVSAWSNAAGITIPYTIPPPPTGTTMSANLLRWTDNSTNETGFLVQRKDAACAAIGTFATLTTTAKDETTYTDAAVSEGGTYCYRVAATNPAGTSAFSNTAERTVPWTIPVAPGQLDVVAGE